MKNQNLNLFIAVIIVIGFVFFWDAFIVSKYAPPKRKAPATEASPAKTAEFSSAPSMHTSLGDSKKYAPKENPVLMKVLEDERNRVTFETNGAKVISWQIREQDHWIELVGTPRGPGYFPLESFPEVNFVVDSVGAKQIVFSGLLPSGIVVRKSLTLSDMDYSNQLVLTLQNPGRQEVAVDGTIEWGGGLIKRNEGKPTNSKTEDATRAEIRAIGLVDKVRSWKAGAFFGKEKDENVTGPFKWVGVDNEHFLACFVPESGAIQNIRVGFDKLNPPSISIPISEKIGPKSSKTIAFKVFIGPKRLETLAAAGSDLKLAVDYGILEKYLLEALHFVHRYTHNFGWSIILLTIVIQILMFPLTRKSLQSSLKMKAIQPQIKKVQELYKNDTQRLHIETMNLYKKHGMKFMGLEGCLPLVLQMPIFYAIFKMLRSAYELRGAPWVLWVKDLSAADPTYVLPVLMGLGMFIQQKTTTVSVDPAQAKMMYIFPVVLTFMFSSMPTGLVLYWIVQSAATIVIQKILMMKLGSPAPAK